MNIGLLIIATNKYTRFLQPLISSADKHFLKNDNVTYFVFTNEDIKIESNRPILYTKIQHKPWPWMTLGRYHTFIQNAKVFDGMDYLYYCDADMLFVNDVGSEILSERVATQHPGFYLRRGTPETNPQSSAYVGPQEKMQYFAGGFNGGSRNEYLSMAKTISNNIDIDFSKNIIAIWHDESHLNRYFIDNPPTKILSPSYCYGESMRIPFEMKLIALDKNHQEIRSEI